MTAPLYLSAGQSSGVASAMLAGQPRDTASQLAAARKLGLRGAAGKVPPRYFADAPAPAARPSSSVVCHPSSVVRP